MSMFSGLYGMAHLPVASLTTGGFWWITNLTLPDPFFILPIATAVTTLISLEVSCSPGSNFAGTRHWLDIIKLFTGILLHLTLSQHTVSTYSVIVSCYSTIWEAVFLINLFTAWCRRCLCIDNASNPKMDHQGFALYYSSIYVPISSGEQ